MACFALPAPAEARLGDSVAASRELAKHHGAASVRLYTEPTGAGEGLAQVVDEQAKVVQATWVAPAAGWSLEQANAFLKVLVGGRRRLMVKTSRSELGYVYTFRYQEDVVARCVYEQNRVREITATAPAYVEADAVETRFSLE